MTADERRLLGLLAASEDGATDALLRAHGFTLSLMIDVVRAGHATAKAGRTFATGGRAVEVTKVRITGPRPAGAGRVSRVTALTLRPTWPDRPAERPVSDFSVIDVGRSVGRIYKTSAPVEDWFLDASLDAVRPLEPACF
jgi:hypothetical protein